MNSDRLCCDRIYKGNEKGASCAAFEHRNETEGRLLRPFSQRSASDVSPHLNPPRASLQAPAAAFPCLFCKNLLYYDQVKAKRVRPFL